MHTRLAVLLFFSVESASICSIGNEQLALESNSVSLLQIGAGRRLSAIVGEVSLSPREPEARGLHQCFYAMIELGFKAIDEAWTGKASPKKLASQSNKETAEILLLVVLTVSVWITLTGACAHLYIRHKRWPEPSPDADPENADLEFQHFSSGVLDCSQDFRSCCWAAWCPCIRWADNMKMLGIVGYWIGTSLFCSIVILSAFSGCVVLWCAASLLWMSYRQRLRQKFGMDHGSLRTYVVDYLLYCCCCQCAIAQETRHIEAAVRAGHVAVSEPPDYDEPMEILGVSMDSKSNSST